MLISQLRAVKCVSSTSCTLQASPEAICQDLCVTEMHTKVRAQQTANQP